MHAQWCLLCKHFSLKRARHPVPMSPGGFLNDYVPFYFTPFSVMMRNIRSGRGGVQQRENEETLILVSSLHHLSAQERPFLFTDSHAYYRWATTACCSFPYRVAVSWIGTPMRWAISNRAF